MQTEKQHVGAEAAIWAEDTPYTKDELRLAYTEYCERETTAGREPEDCQRFFERYISD